MSAINESNMSDSINNLTGVKLLQLRTEWIQRADNHLSKKLVDDDGLVYKISCCYFVFAKAAMDYKDAPDALKIARMYCHKIINIIENITGENIQELADRINGKEKSVPTNILYWCDVIDLKKEQIYKEIYDFIQGESDDIINNSLPELIAQVEYMKKIINN